MLDSLLAAAKRLGSSQTTTTSRFDPEPKEGNTVQTTETVTPSQSYRPTVTSASNGQFVTTEARKVLNSISKDGVIQTTEAKKHLQDVFGMSGGWAGNTIFRWTDPTGKPGYRKLRTKGTRRDASDPNEGEENVKPKSAVKLHAPAIEVNPNGDLYRGPNSGGPYGVRKTEVFGRVKEYQEAFGNEQGFWSLRRMNERLANDGVNPQVFYTMVRKMVQEGLIIKKGLLRHVPASTFQSLGISTAQPQGSNVEEFIADEVEQYEDNDDVRLWTPDDFAAAGGRKAVAERLGDVREDINEMVAGRLALTPETQKDIDALVRDAILESAKRQLGVW